jgi:HPt (histidine-containing phosphotransfer) domain-containing protein
MREDRSAIAHPEVRPAAGGEAVGDRPEELPEVDESVIEQLASITDGQGFSVLGELLNAFLTAVPGRLEALDREVVAGNLVSVGHQAHSLTGSAASFGARRMADICRQLRVAADDGDHAHARQLVAALRAEFLKVRAWLVTFQGRA